MIAQRTWAFAGAGVSAAAAGVELVRLIVVGAVRNLEMSLTLVSSITFVAVLAGTAAGMALHRRVGWLLGTFGVLALLGYGFIIQAAANHVGRVQDPMGIPYVVLGLALFVCLVKSLPYFRGEVVAEPA